jgi:hypothetical protein
MNQEFGPFTDFSKLTDDEIIERLNKLSNMISYYYWSNYNYLVPQLQEWQDAHRNELTERAEKRRRDKNKHKENNVIFDNSDEVIEAEKAAKEEKNKDK